MAQSGRGTPEPQAPPAWRAPEGPEAWLWHPWAAAGTGELRGGARLRRPWAAAGPGHTRTTGTAGVKGARENRGPGCGARGRRAWPGTPEPQAPPAWRAPEGPEGTGGLRGAAPNEVRSPSLAGGRGLRRPEHQRGHRHKHRHGHGHKSGPEPLGSGPPSVLSGCRRCATGDQQRATRVSSARPPCRPCRSSRR